MKTEQQAQRLADSLMAQLPGNAGKWYPYVWQNGLWFAEIRQDLAETEGHCLVVAPLMDGNYIAYIRNRRGLVSCGGTDLKEGGKTVPLALIRLHRMLDAARRVIEETLPDIAPAVNHIGAIVQPDPVFV